MRIDPTECVPLFGSELPQYRGDLNRRAARAWDLRPQVNAAYGLALLANEPLLVCVSRAQVEELKAIFARQGINDLGRAVRFLPGEWPIRRITRRFVEYVADPSLADKVEITDELWHAFLEVASRKALPDDQAEIKNLSYFYVPQLDPEPRSPLS